MIPVVLTIAGSDSGGGAGIQGDLLTLAAHGVHGATAVAAVTAQNTEGITATYPMAAAAVVEQIEAVCRDLRVAAAKTGMLGTAAVVEAVAAAVRRLAIPSLVVDPVLAASSGESLVGAGGVEAYRRFLIPQARVVTPNLAEAESLLGAPVRDVSEMRAAARALVALGAASVIIKGGHLEGDAIDVFADATRVEELTAPRIDTPDVHGTGCAFSASLAAHLAKGAGPLDAARAAKAYVAEAIRRAHAVGHGRLVLGSVATTPVITDDEPRR